MATTIGLQQASLAATQTAVSDTYAGIGVGVHETHAVQFYEDDDFLVGAVGDFLASGLAIGQPVIAVATREHRDRIRQHLESRGFNVDRAALRGQLTLADADQLLATFMDGSMPNAERCRASVGAILRDHHRDAAGVTVRVYGEMVDVLCRRGNVAGALRLEELWNELASAHRFSLLCGYSMRSFSDETHAKSFASVCDRHAHVIPTERYMSASEGGRLREIAVLQQRARALESEIERREDAERSLRVALGKAEAANRAKNQFLAVMSHELRTPLNAIGGHVQLMEMELHGPINDRQRDALDRVQRSQRHLLGLINDVLNLARLESAQVVYTAERVEVAELLSEVASLLEPLFAAKSLTCEVICPMLDPPLVACGDRDKVHQILLNLMGNAIKFTPSGGRVTVCPRVGSDPSSPIEIVVSDTGIGMPTEKLEAIFEPFVQIGGDTNGKREGVGLGLSISRTLARGMGGDLTAESEASSGSTFTLTLPRQ
jgi:signal transduction histidine kinase